MPERSLELKNVILLICIRRCLSVSQLERPCTLKFNPLFNNKHVTFKHLSDRRYGSFS